MAQGLVAFKKLTTGGLSPQEHDEYYRIVKDELKAFDIIENKGVDIAFLRSVLNVEAYNAIQSGHRTLSQPEFDALKKVLRK